MKIEASLEVTAVMERMGTEATREEAVAMIEFLLVGDYENTEDIPEGEWLELCEIAAEGVRRNAELAADRRANA